MDRVRPNFPNKGRWVLHYDNAPAQFVVIVSDFLVGNPIITLSHPPYPTFWFLAISTKCQETMKQLKSLTSAPFKNINNGNRIGEYFEGDKDILSNLFSVLFWADLGLLQAPICISTLGPLIQI